MQRREALKNLGFGSMALFTSTVFFGALQGCSAATEVDWKPAYLTAKEASQLGKVCEGIMPKTATPGAIEAGVPSHLDSALSHIYKDAEAEYFKRGLNIFVAKFNSSQEVSFDKATTNQMTDAIRGYFDKYKADGEILKNYRAEFKKEGEKDDAFVETYFVTNVVDSTIWSYFSSELVGKEVMAYDPIPGMYEGCIPYEPGQKAWSNV
ncbi:gluconate 2-dehydrogenase subunit 3 family protein [Roseivirga echinicomitans]